MSEPRQNCWEFKKCGREPGGAKIAELGVCPAAKETTFDGIFGGRNSGRACWVVAGTFCKGEVQGTFAQKFRNCGTCEFFKQVQKEEGAQFHPVNVLMTYIDKTHEQRVGERTHEIQEAKDAVEAANQRLAEVNEELAEVNRKAELDMDMAARIQASFFPKNPPRSATWDIAFSFKPLSGVSGDLYDFFWRNGELSGVSLFDVSGHGISSGLLTLLARSIISRHVGSGEGRSLSAIITAVNEDLIRELKAIDNYLTGILLRFDGSRVEYVNAGHADLLVRKASSGTVHRIAPKGTDFKGNFLGVAALENRFRTVSFKLEKADSLLLYSDCLSESRNEAGEEFGEEGIIRAFRSAPDNAGAEELLAHIDKEFSRHTGDRKLRDDLTIIVAKRKSEGTADWAI